MSPRRKGIDARRRNVNGLVTEFSSALESLLNELHEPEPDAGPGIGNRRLRNFFHEIYQPYRLSESSEKTIQSYVTTIERFALFLKRPATLDDLRDDAVSNFLLWTRNLPRAIPTVLRERAHLLAQWRFGWKKRLVDELPRDVVNFKPDKQIPRAWSVEEFGRIIVACDVLTGVYFDIESPRWWRALLWLLYDTGLRLRAALNLMTADLDTETGWLAVPADEQKQKAEQVFKLHPDTLAVIVATDPAGRERLFPCAFKHPDEKQHLYRRLNRILDAAGLPKTSKDKFHKIRRTCATLVADLAGDEAAQKHLGHSSLALTRDSYLDPRYIRRRIITAEELPRPNTNGNEPEAA